MAITTKFPGSSLPAGWTALTPSGSTVVVADGWLKLTAAGGTAYDGISASNGVNGGICAYHALPNPGGAFDIAMQVSTDVGDTKAWGVYLAVCDVDGEDNSGGGWARYGISRPNTDVERPNRFAGSRPAGSGTGSGGTNHYNVSVNNSPMGLQSGMPSYIRLAFDGVDLFQPYLSTDGFNWVADTTFTRAFDPTRLLVLFTSTGPNTAGTMHIAAVHDLLALGTTDLRDPRPDFDRVSVSSFDGTVGSLPAGWVDDSAGGDSVTFTGTAVRLASDAALVGSRARVRWDGARYQSCGLLLRVNWPSFDSDLFNTWGLMTDEGSSQDPYIRVGGGYGLERGGTAIRPIRIDNPFGSNVASVPGTTGLDEKPYAWLKDLTGDNIAIGAPTRMIRLERPYVEASRAWYRVKIWNDAGSLAASLAAEPDEWAIFEGQDDIERSDLGPLLTLAHNNPGGGLTGTGQQDLLWVDFYELVEAAESPTVDRATDAEVARSVGVAMSVPVARAVDSDVARTVGSSTVAVVARAVDQEEPQVAVAATAVAAARAVDGELARAVAEIAGAVGGLRYIEPDRHVRHTEATQ